jgi:hypothetical protein
MATFADNKAVMAVGESVENNQKTTEWLSGQKKTANETQGIQIGISALQRILDKNQSSPMLHKFHMPIQRNTLYDS